MKLSKTLTTLLGASLFLVSTASFAVSVETAKGNVDVKATPKAVVTLDVAILDDLHALGQKAVGTTKTALPDYLQDDYKDVARVGDLFKVDLDKLKAVNPDLIIVSGRSSKLYDEVSGVAQTINLSLNQKNQWADFERNMHTLGQIFGQEKKADAIVKDLNDSAATLSQKAQKVGDAVVLLTMGEDKLIVQVPHSRFGLIYDKYGFKPNALVQEKEKVVAKTEEGKRPDTHVSFEDLAKANPDWIFVIDRSEAIKKEGPRAKAYFDNDLIKKTKAGKNGHVVFLNAYNWYVVGTGATAIKEDIQEIDAAVSK